MITDEMVETASKAEWTHVASDVSMPWVEVDGDTKDRWRASVRAGLEAVMAKLVVAAVHEVDSLVEFTLVIGVVRTEPASVALRLGDSSRTMTVIQGDSLIVPVKMTMSDQ